VRRHQWRRVKSLRNALLYRPAVWSGLLVRPGDVGRAPCGCLYDHLGDALLVCAFHVRDVEGVTGHVRLRGADGELRLVPTWAVAGIEAT
jgi:hypothetical protein